VEAVLVQDVKVPKLGLGTWDLRGERATEAVLSALELGYRHIDTAEMYRNEREIGRALTQSGVERQEIFLVSKVWTNHLHKDQVIDACQASLERLGTEYLDLYLVHWPSGSVPVEQTMEGMQELLQSQAARQVGVSNFSVVQMERASQALGSKVFCNQVKMHVGHKQGDIVDYCQKNDVLLTAYTPLNKGRIGTNQTLKEIAERYGKQPLQVALRWLIQQQNVAAIPKSSSRQHQADNIDIFDFELSDEDMERISQLE
jgi:diketogulonate reductase-like aldo/keto reductase